VDTPRRLKRFQPHSREHSVDGVRLISVRRIGALLAATVLALAACGGAAETGPTTDSSSPTAEPDARAVAVYSAIIRQLVTKDHTFGDDESPFDRVFIDVRIDDGAGDPGAQPPTGPRLTADEQAAILRELADLPRVEFVQDPDSVVVGEKSCAHVKGNGVLITLGRISGGSQRVTVPNDLFFACLGGQWLTYVLESAKGDWQVVGTKGGIAIS
jgi:hypothetical protein